MGISIVEGGAAGPFTLIVDRLDRASLDRALEALGSPQPRPDRPVPSDTPASNDEYLGRLASLTESEEKVYRFVEKTLRERGYPPSIREISAGIGLFRTAPSGVRYVLQKLESKGYLAIDKSYAGARHRGIRLCTG